MGPTGERTEKATPRRLLKARREGQVASSRDFVSGLQFAVFSLLLVETGPRLLSGLKQATRLLIAQAFRADLGPAGLIDLLHQAFASTLTPMLTVGAILVATSIFFQLGSTGFV